MKPVLIIGGTHIDVRGSLRFCNDLDMTRVQRFYTVSNSAEQPIRGWIGHKRESKWFFPLSGKTEIIVEPMDEANSSCSARQQYSLDAASPSVLYIPPNNWFFFRQDGHSEVMVFSDSKVGEFENDDFRRKYEET